MVFFDTLIKRTNCFSLESYHKNKDNIFQFFENNELFQLSILIASRSLYDDLKKGKNHKTIGSIKKYFSRSHFKPTPFGVFSSVGILKWSDTNFLFNSKDLKLDIKYDNLYVTEEIKQLTENNFFFLEYCLNPSVHFLTNDKVSFYNFIIKNGIIKTSYLEIDYDENTDWLIKRFNKKTKIADVFEELINLGHAEKDIKFFFQEVIENGLLINFYLYDVYSSKLSKNIFSVKSNIVKQQYFTLSSQKSISNFINSYIEDQDLFLKNKENRQNIYIINSYDNTNGTIDSKIKNKINKFIEFNIYYNSQNKPFNTKIKEFANEISKVHNDGFIPINDIFNPYSGFDYINFQSTFKYKFNNEILNKILLCQDKHVILDLPKKELIEEKNSNLPATFNVVMEILVCKQTQKEIIYFKNLGGSSALNLISRFDELSHDLIMKIVNYEKNVNTNKIIAEINCIPNLRSCNMYSSKQYFDFSIPVNNSYSSTDNTIFLSDIYLKLNNGNISLFSKKFNKEILPIITSAINFKLSDSNIYRFLSEIQYMNKEIYSVEYNFNHIENFPKSYIPRIYLDSDVLLYPAQLLIPKVNFKTLSELKNHIKEQIKKYNFTSNLLFSDQKGEIIIDSDKEEHIKLIAEKFKNKNYIYVSEFIYDVFNPGVKNISEKFSHEIIVSVKNEKYVSRHEIQDDFSLYDNKDNIPIVSDWLYIEVYCNSFASKDVIRFINRNIIEKNKCTDFFFVRYSNPNKHLRLRFKTLKTQDKTYIIEQISFLKEKKIISNYLIKPYEREIFRYGGLELMNLSETIFSLDTLDLINTVITKDLEEDDILIISILKIKNYLSFFDLNIDQMITYCENCIKMFSEEFLLDKNLRKKFNEKYLNIKDKINFYEYENKLVDRTMKENFSSKINNNNKHNIISLIIHMSMNRHFQENQRFNEFISYYITKLYLNKIRYTNLKFEA